jgi:DNA-binding response OmpR family regulator
MDGSLPFLDGLSATRRIRENGLGDQVKILALNGWGSPSYHAAALAAGCDDCIVKPFNIDQLRGYLVPLFAFSSYAPSKQVTVSLAVPSHAQEQMSNAFSG